MTISPLIGMILLVALVVLCVGFVVGGDYLYRRNSRFLGGVLILLGLVPLVSILWIFYWGFAAGLGRALR